MATKPRITRLGDPANPYGKKATPTRARTDKEKMEALARQREPAPRKAAPASPARKTSPGMKRLNEEYMDARHRAIDNAVEGKKRRR